MKWGSGISEALDFDTALREASEQAAAMLGSARPSLVFTFVAVHYGDALAKTPAIIKEIFGDCQHIGCSAGGVIGNAREVELKPAVSVTVADLPGVEIAPIRMTQQEHIRLHRKAKHLRAELGLSEESTPHFVLLPDPYSFDIEFYAHLLDEAYPKSTKIGGLASGGMEPGANFLFANGQTYTDGMIGVALQGNIEVDSIVAQGCRPIGTPMFITKCEQHILKELDCRRPTECLEELLSSLSHRDQELFNRALFLGVVMDPEKKEFEHGDFLIRNIIGVDPRTGVLGVGANLNDAQVVQFHLRDAETSRQDLTLHLERYVEGGLTESVAGALLFSCAGRGEHLYGVGNHDSALFQELLAPLPLGGFFCNGEIGPVQGRTFVHGFTSSFGLFRPAAV